MSWLYEYHDKQAYPSRIPGFLTLLFIVGVRVVHLVSFLYFVCFDCLCLVPSVVCVSWLSVLDYPFGFRSRVSHCAPFFHYRVLIKHFPCKPRFFCFGLFSCIGVLRIKLCRTKPFYEDYYTCIINMESNPCEIGNQIINNQRFIWSAIRHN